jgi:photosystem II stability/assembly factor-like uncharacterized protein
MKKVIILSIIGFILISCKKENSNQNNVQWIQLKGFPIDCYVPYMVLINDTLVVSNYGNAYGKNDGIYISSDSGNTWSNNSTRYSIKVEPLITDGRNLYAGTMGDGVFFSNDMGKHWVEKNNGLPSNFYVMDMIQSKNKIFLCGNGIYYLMDTSSTWHDITPPGTTQAYSIIEFDSTIISSFVTNTLAATYKSSTNNINWIPIIKSTSGLNTIRVRQFFLKKNIIFAASEFHDGIYVSSDNGVSWTKGQGFKGYVYNFASYNELIFVSAGQDGVFKSVDNGNSWTNIGCNDAISIAVMHNSLYAGTKFHGIWKLSL